MSKAEKQAWLENASNDEVLNQMKWSVIKMTSPNSSIQEHIEGNEDYELVLAELKKRLDGTTK